MVREWTILYREIDARVSMESYSQAPTPELAVDNFLETVEDVTKIDVCGVYLTYGGEF